ncbi:MAG TPA: hypothetical protein VMI33_16290, partial [Streptosporangiaceae bacterium]|nr:hypothetical protein [Streptosporangiaceae bacterium]
RNSTLVMPVPVELLRFFEKMAPSSTPAAASSPVDTGDAVVAEAEAEIGSPLAAQLPDVPMPELAAPEKLAEEGSPEEIVAAERNSTLVMPVPVELLRFFDKFSPPAPGAPGRDSASLADFGNEDVEKVEAEIESGAPLSIPDVPEIPELPGADAGLDKVATDAKPEATTISPKAAGDGRTAPKRGARAAAGDTAAGDTAAGSDG